MVDHINADAVARLFVRRVDEWAGRVAFRFKHQGAWESSTWRDYGEAAKAVGLGLLSLGLGKGDVVALALDSQPVWLATDMGAICAGFVTVGLVESLDHPATEAILRDLGVRAVFVEDDEQARKIRDMMPRLEFVIQHKKGRATGEPQQPVLSYDALCDQGRQLGQTNLSVWQAAIAAAGRDDVVTMVADTDGCGAQAHRPLTNADILARIKSAEALYSQCLTRRQLSFLTMGNAAERVLSEFLPLGYGSTVSFAESNDTAVADLREVKPTIFFAPPRVWEKFHSDVSMRMEDATGMGRIAFRAAFALGRRAARLRRKGKAPGVAERLGLWLADLIVFGNIKRFMGLDEARSAATGIAPISPALVEWYAALGIDLRELRDLAESGTFTLAAGGGDPGSAGTGPHLEVRSAEAELRRSPYIVDAAIIDGPKGERGLIVEMDQENVRAFFQKNNRERNASMLSVENIADDIIKIELDNIDKFMIEDKIIEYIALPDEDALRNIPLDPALRLNRSSLSRLYAGTIGEAAEGWIPVASR